MKIEDEDEDPRVALTAALMVCEWEGELVALPPTCEVDHEAAATVFLLADAGCTLPEAAAYLRRQGRV